MQSSSNRLYFMENSTKGCLEKLTYIEQRMERFMQDGMESCRHICQVVDEFDMQVSGGSVQWPTRRALEEQMSWSAARARFGELGSVEAWNLVVQGGYKQVQGMVQDHKWSAQTMEDRLKSGEKMEPQEEKNMKKQVQWHHYNAKRLEHNMQYLKANVELLKGNDDCEDLQAEMGKLQKEFLEMKSFRGTGAADAQASREFYTSAVAFRSADLAPEVKKPMKAPTPPLEHHSEEEEH